MLLAGDIGGTKTLLGLFAPDIPRPWLIDARVYATLQFDGLLEMIAAFMKAQPDRRRQIRVACFGVAGPVLGRRARLTNVPWEVDADESAEGLGVRVSLLNDLEAMGYAVPVLAADELEVLQEGERLPSGNGALIAAGTGLGEAVLHNVSGRLIPSASEGGHADFAARTEREMDLLRALTRWYGRACCERVISGPGLLNVHRFVHGDRGCPALAANDAQADLAAVVSRAALEHRCARCVETLDMFVSAYGSEAGNLALRAVATGGFYVGGGIAPKILPALRNDAFMTAFRTKPPLGDLLRRIPVFVILNPRAGLLGAAVHANYWIEAERSG